MNLLLSTKLRLPNSGVCKAKELGTYRKLDHTMPIPPPFHTADCFSSSTPDPVTLPGSHLAEGAHLRLAQKVDALRARSRQGVLIVHLNSSQEALALPNFLTDVRIVSRSAWPWYTWLSHGTNCPASPSSCSSPILTRPSGAQFPKNSGKPQVLWRVWSRLGQQAFGQVHRTLAVGCSKRRICQ